MSLEGKVAVVYSGARGIGKAYCGALLQKGCKVCFGDILEQEGLDTQQELREKCHTANIVFQKCDVLIHTDVKDLLSLAVTTYGAADIVIANAGVVAENDWQKCIDLNLSSAMRVFYTAMEHMNKSEGGKGGHFVVTSSLAGLKPVMAMPVYTATKQGLVGFIRAWGTPANYQVTGIRCSALCPHTVATKFVTDPNQSPFLLKEHGQMMMAAVQGAFQNNHVLQPEDVGSSLISLLEDQDSNGRCLEVTHEGGRYVTFQEEAI